MKLNEKRRRGEGRDPGAGHDYDAREEHVAQGHRPEDVGGTEDTHPAAEREHPGDTPGGA